MRSFTEVSAIALKHAGRVCAAFKVGMIMLTGSADAYGMGSSTSGDVDIDVVDREGSIVMRVERLLVVNLNRPRE